MSCYSPYHLFLGTLLPQLSCDHCDSWHVVPSMSDRHTSPPGIVLASAEGFSVQAFGNLLEHVNKWLTKDVLTSVTREEIVWNLLQLQHYLKVHPHMYMTSYISSILRKPQCAYFFNSKYHWPYRDMWILTYGQQLWNLKCLDNRISSLDSLACIVTWVKYPTMYTGKHDAILSLGPHPWDGCVGNNGNTSLHGPFGPRPLSLRLPICTSQNQGMV